MTDARDYAGGPERRRRFVYTTRNTEYHVFDDVCVAVRNRRSKQWYEQHPALGRRLEGGVRCFDSGAVVPSLERPELGSPMFFVVSYRDEDVEQLVTSRLEGVDRPERSDLRRYKIA